MKLSPWYLAPAALVAGAVASHGSFAPQLAVLGLALGIFFGTLSLRRPGGDATSTNPGHG
ncbi:MAG TPA: hypothetical protein VHE30_11805 [Polyangiaceae bacterium]|nr:hypothetical protein [Polyangiaceae bacterium]